MKKQWKRVGTMLAAAAMIGSISAMPVSAMSADTQRFIKTSNQAIAWGTDDPVSYAEYLESQYYGNRTSSWISYHYETGDLNDMTSTADLNAMAQEIAEQQNSSADYGLYGGYSGTYTYDDAGYIATTASAEIADPGYTGDSGDLYHMTRSYTYDAQGYVSARADIGRGYDASTDSVTDINDNTSTAYTYDSKGNISTEMRDNGDVETYTCDKYGRISDRVWTDPDGSSGKHHFSYKNNRLTKSTYSDADETHTITFTYDANRRLVSAVRSTVDTDSGSDSYDRYYIFTYDAGGRLAEITTHDTAGNSWFIAYAY